MRIRFWFFCAIALFALVWLALPSDPVSAQNPAPTGSEVGITENLGDKIPADIELVDESGNLIRIGSLFGKPTILAFGYFECPSICGPLLTNRGETVDAMQIEPGLDYRILAVSFDPEEDSVLASRKKANFIKVAEKRIPEDGWRFLTGDEDNIRALTQAAGFRYKKVGNEYAHPAALIVLSPEGKIVRYLQGVSHPPADVELALSQAAKGVVSAARPQGDANWGPSRDRMQYLAFCFSYDAASGRYIFNFTRVAGILILIAAISFIAIVVLRSSQKRKGAENDKPLP